jgi:proton-coupled amino acid transporter
LLIPILALCSIRHLSELAPLALISNVIYVVGIAIIAVYLFTEPKPSWSLPAFGSWQGLPLFFGTVIFAFEGVAIVSLPLLAKFSTVAQRFISRSL